MFPALTGLERYGRSAMPMPQGTGRAQRPALVRRVMVAALVDEIAGKVGGVEAPLRNA
jgi:hypothetical protein